MSSLYAVSARAAMAALALILSVASVAAQTVPTEGRDGSAEGPAEAAGARSPRSDSSKTEADSSKTEGEEAASEADQEIKQDRKLPILDGHRFIPSSTVPDPFITTYLRSNTGFGLLLDASTRSLPRRIRSRSWRATSPSHCWASSISR